jgi:cytochrome c
MVKLCATLLVVLAACPAFAQQTAPSMAPKLAVKLGRQIAQQNCQSCHALGTTQSSPNPSAPPLRTLGQRYPIDTLAEAFGEGILVGHSPMPEFELQPRQIEALLAYLKTIQVPAHPRPTKGKAH